MRTIALVAGLSLAGAAPVPSAQDTSTVRLGTLVRVTAPGVAPTVVVGTLIERTDSAIVVLEDKAGPKTIPLASMTKMEWSEGRHGHVAQGALIGAVVFAGVGGLDGGRYAEGAASGVVWGALVGVLARHHGWKEISAGSARIGIAPGPRGVSARAVLTW